ncbi:MAG: 4Fe-4S binding protein [Syntrophomonadaceae bacterium]|nr:4Fe-4S binding protein [Syntrophomonadaceae bacterium]
MEVNRVREDNFMDIRRIVQWISAIISNAYYKGYTTLSIYQGPAKKACVPFLNCYSCPGALGSCPIGAMQSLLASLPHQFSFYVAGLLTATGAAVGRFACGWLCPFGLFQELLAKLNHKKYAIPAALKKLKYIILVLTLLLPVIWVNEAGLASPYFCKFLCPAGTLEAGLPLGLGNPELSPLLGKIFTWKVILLIIFIVASIFTFRPFCRTICPLGAFYALFNPISMVRLETNSTSCIACGKCSQACPMDIDVESKPNDPECIRCLKCKNVCPTGALYFSTRPAPKNILEDNTLGDNRQ